MVFFSVLAAIVLQHFRPLRQPLPHYRVFADVVHWLEVRLDGGETGHGVLAWFAAVLPLVAGVWLVSVLLTGISPLLAAAWNIAVLYFTMGFKYFSDDAEWIARLLRAGEVESARDRLAAWQGRMSGAASSEWDASDVARITIERIFSESLRQMFGVLFWFVVLADYGPIGAVLYRASSILSRRWTQHAFGDFARKAFVLINWLPVRLTALTYAVAGDFEDAMYCWRTQAPVWPDTEEGIVLAAGAGAMGVRLGRAPSGRAAAERVPRPDLPAAAPASPDSMTTRPGLSQPFSDRPTPGHGSERPELGLGQYPEADHIDSTVSMVWRGLTIWLVVGVLLVIAGWAN